MVQVVTWARTKGVGIIGGLDDTDGVDSLDSGTDSGFDDGYDGSTFKNMDKLNRSQRIKKCEIQLDKVLNCGSRLRFRSNGLPVGLTRLTASRFRILATCIGRGIAH